MDTNLNAVTNTKMVCVQPWCLLKKKGLTVEDIARFLIKSLAGEPHQVENPESRRIVARSQCILCALRVMQGRKAFLSHAEWDHLDDLGHWHHKRQRRQQRWVQ